MIKSYSEITGKYLRANKKRTVLTLIGIILSVALISAIGFFLESMQEAQIQDMKNNYGSWHVMFNKVDESLITKIKNNPVVLRSGTYTMGKEKSIGKGLKVREVYGSDEGLELSPYSLKGGKLPKTNNEIVMENWFLNKVNPSAKIGDTIKILDKKYVLVGILKDTIGSQSEGVGEVVTNDPSINKENRILLVEVKKNGGLSKNIAEVKRLSSPKNVVENKFLIMTEGEGMPKGLIGILAIIIGIVVISTIAVIYNAFQIGVVDRVKQFGLLRAVGATPKQIRRIILREATFLALIGIPIGIGFGVAALYGIDLTFKLIGGENVVLETPTISLNIILISTLISLLSIYISAFLPAIFAGKISPLVAISSRNSITKEKLKRRKSPIMSKLFGFEGAIASKNIRRNRKRYRITVFSIIISVALFISFKSFMDMSLNVYGETNESDKMHFSVVTMNDSKGNRSVDENVIEKINKLPYVNSVYRVYKSYDFDAVINKDKELKDVRNIGGIYSSINYKGENKTLMSASMAVYDNKSLEVAKQYLKEGNIDIKKLNSENGVIIIGKNRIYNAKAKRSFYGPSTGLRTGDEILLQSNELGNDNNNGKVEFGKGKIKKVKVLAVLEGNPFTFRGSESGIKIITTKEVAERLVSENIMPNALNIKIKDAKLEIPAKRDIENIISASGNLRLINIIDQNRTTNGVILMVKILLYGFVIVVSLIGSVNIINTLTTNIILRRREFAALKSIGLTQRGLKKMITIEGVLYGIMGSIYGSLIGLLLSYMLFKSMSDVREQSYPIPLSAIIIASAGAMLIGYLSVLSPIKRMKRDNLIDAVREDF